MAVVYLHTKKNTNEVFYVGIGKTEKRAYSKLGRNIHWKRIVEKYDYDVEIVHTNLDWSIACEIEKSLINQYGRDNLSNMTDGGEGITNPSKELRDKMSKAQIGKKQSLETIEKRVSKIKGRPLSEEHKEKLRQAKLGNKNPNYGKTFKLSSEHKQAIRNANIGKTHSDETKKKMSEMRVGKSAWNKGKSFSAETKEKMRISKLGNTNRKNGSIKEVY
jgi:ubiquitin